MGKFFSNLTERKDLTMIKTPGATKQNDKMDYIKLKIVEQKTQKTKKQNPNARETPQPHPLAERLPKIIIRSQTPQNTPPDAVLLTRKTRSSLIHQNTGTSPLHQEAYTTH